MSQKSIAESARMLRWLVIAALALTILAFLVSRAGLYLDGHVLIVRQAEADGPAARIVADAAVVLFVVSLVQLIRLLGELSSGKLFAASITRAFRSFAFWMLMSALVAIVGTPLASALSAAATGTFQLELKISLRDVMYLIAGLVMFLIARMLDEAARLDSELKEIV